MSKSSKKTKDIDAVDEGGLTALHHAALNGDVSEVERLLAAGAKIDARTTEQYFARDSTPLILATRYQKFAVLQLLLDRGADIEARDNEGYGNENSYVRSNNDWLAGGRRCATWRISDYCIISFGKVQT